MKTKNFMREMHVDIETFSSVDLKTCGVYRYAEEAEILIVCWALDGSPVVERWSCDQGPPPATLLALLDDPTVRKHAHNAAFERTLFRAAWRLKCSPEQWACTMVLCFNLGLPGSLDEAGALLRLPQDQQKSKYGMALIHTFSSLRSDGSRIMPSDMPEQWQQFIEYCSQDVIAERAVYDRLSWYEIPQIEWALWYLDQEINDRGVPVDTQLAKAVIEMTEQRNQQLMILARLEGIKNPKSVKQVKDWLVSKGYDEPASLTKKDVLLLLEQVRSEERTVLNIRLQLCRSSISKYKAFIRCVCRDGRARGLLQFFGAIRTGRWAGRLVQVHNLKSNDPDAEAVAMLRSARIAVKHLNMMLLEMVADDIADVFSQLVRTTICCNRSTRLMPCDYSAIEARVLAWAANEEWRLEVFRTHGRIYETSAERMFSQPAGSVTKKSPLRKKGKVAELACGYGGASGALIAMGATEMGLKVEELQPIIDAWREANPRIVKFWRDIELHARRCIEKRTPQGQPGIYTFTYEKGFLFMGLPSGRKLAYPQARVIVNEGGWPAIQFWGKEKDRRNFAWVDTYGGKLTENYVQAVARDILGQGMLDLTAAGYDLVLHVHDEPVPEMPYGKGSIAEMEQILSRPISWAKGLPMKAEGNEMQYYLKED